MLVFLWFTQAAKKFFHACRIVLVAKCSIGGSVNKGEGLQQTVGTALFLVSYSNNWILLSFASRDSFCSAAHHIKCHHELFYTEYLGVANLICFDRDAEKKTWSQKGTSHCSCITIIDDERGYYRLWLLWELLYETLHTVQLMCFSNKILNYCAIPWFIEEKQ